MERGHDCHKIAHVPYIKIDNKIQSNWMQMQNYFSQSPGQGQFYILKMLDGK